MREAIDFQDFDMNGKGFDEPKFCPVHRETLPTVITGGVRVDRSGKTIRGVKYPEIFKAPAIPADLLEYKQTAVFENGEASPIHALCERIKGQSIIQLAFKMQTLLGLPLEVAYMQMCAAYLRDVADNHIDLDAVHNCEGYVREPVLSEKQRFPRLTELALINMSAFRIFQKKINMYGIGLGDLTQALP